MSVSDVRRAKRSFDRARALAEARGQEVVLVVVGYVTGREPFRLMGRVSADMSEDALPDPPLTQSEMQPVAFAAKMALAKVLLKRRRNEVAFAKVVKGIRRGPRR